MQKKRSKRYRAAEAKIESHRKYQLTDAIEILKSLPAPKFDQTVTLSFKLGVDPKQSDQMVRGTCPLPNGSGKNVRVLVFATGQAAEAAKEAGEDPPEEETGEPAEQPRRGPGRFAARNMNKPKPVWGPAKKKPTK